MVKIEKIVRMIGWNGKTCSAAAAEAVDVRFLAINWLIRRRLRAGEEEEKKANERGRSIEAFWGKFVPRHIDVLKKE